MKNIFVAAIAFLLALDAQGFAADGNAARGQRVFARVQRAILCRQIKT
jgi:hypothetical protein